MAEALARLSPDKNPRVLSRSLRRIALETQARATNKIRRGGSLRPAPSVLTSRTGTGRRSISTDLGSLPHSATVGSNLGYMALHEEGGSITRPAHSVVAHTRTVAFGRKLPRFNVPGYSVRAHSARYPARPWLSPAVDEMVPDRASAIVVDEWESES